MPENDYKDFAREVNRLGLEAVAALDSPEYCTALRRLVEYFKNGILYYAAYDFGFPLSRLLPSGLNTGERLGEGRDAVQFYKVMHFAECAMEHLDCLNECVKKYDPEKSGSEEYGFFNYAYGTVKKYSIRYSSREKAKESAASDRFSDSRRELLAKLCRFLKGDDENPEKIREFAEKNGLNYEEIRQEYYPYRFGTVSLDACAEDGEGGSSQISEFLLTEDSNEYNPSEMEEKSDWDHFDEAFLQKLNRVYRESFFENHKAVFPPVYTNKGIKERVEYVENLNFEDESGPKPRSLQETIQRRWDDLLIEDLREDFATGKYFCVDRGIFLWFERVRRIIQDREIAEKLGVSASSLTKIYQSALKVVRKTLFSE